MNNEQILVKFLNCGFLDLKVLEDTKFDVMEIISEMERPTLNDILYVIFQKGIDLLLNALMEKQRDFDCPDENKKPTGIAGGSSYAAQGPILPAARLRACGLFTCILLLATRKRVFKIQC